MQDAFLRWDRADHAAVAAPSAWLAKVVTKLCLNRLASARVQREVYAGPWLPEPVLTAGEHLGPMGSAALRESASMALLVLLERLTPAERAVFVLREAFGYGHGRSPGSWSCRRPIAASGTAVPACGSARSGRFRPARGQWRQLIERFLAAAADGDLPALERMLAADVIAWADGGGKATAARRPVAGRARVARYIAGALGRFGAGVQVRLAEINGEPEVLGLAGGAVVGVLVLAIGGGRIAVLRAPDVGAP